MEQLPNGRIDIRTMNVQSDSESQAGSLQGNQVVYMMYPQEPRLTVDVLGVIRLLYEGKWIVLGLVAFFVTLGVAYSLIATPVFRVESVLISNRSQSNQSITGGLGGLASLAGINIQSTTDETEAIATLRSRVLVEEFIKDHNLLPVLFSDQWDSEASQWKDEDPEEWPSVVDGVEYFIENVYSVEEDATTGLITVAVRWSDPDVAVQWAEQLVSAANEKLRKRDMDNSQKRLDYLNSQLVSANLLELRQAISRLVQNEIQTMTLANAETEYAFKVIDPPRVPERRVSPRILAIVALCGVVGGILGSCVVLFLGWSKVSRQQPVTSDSV